MSELNFIALISNNASLLIKFIFAVAHSYWINRDIFVVIARYLGKKTEKLSGFRCAKIMRVFAMSPCLSNYFAEFGFEFSLLICLSFERMWMHLTAETLQCNSKLWHELIFIYHSNLSYVVEWKHEGKMQMLKMGNNIMLTIRRCGCIIIIFVL